MERHVGKQKCMMGGVGGQGQSGGHRVGGRRGRLVTLRAGCDVLGFVVTLAGAAPRRPRIGAQG